MSLNIDEQLDELRSAACSSSSLDLNETEDHSDDPLWVMMMTGPTPTESPYHTEYPYASSSSSSSSSSFFPHSYRHIEDTLNTKVSVVICAFGLIGNACNLMVFIPQGRRCSMGRIERSVYWGLVALAVSDMLFCLMIAVNGLIEREEVSTEITFSLIYSVYNNAFVNVFVMTSTWLTIVMAIGRYLAICYPFRAREIIGTTVAKRVIAAIYVVSFLVNAPRFFFYKIVRILCESADRKSGDRTYYFRWPSYVHIKTRPELEKAYAWVFFTFGILVPCVLLVFCNAFLVRALRRARTKLRLIRAVEVSSVDQYRTITLVLIALVLMHVVLVSPIEFVFFLRQQLIEESRFSEVFNLVGAVGNALQAVNFSVNFLLYCVINVHFRRALVRLIRFRWLRRFRPRPLRSHLSFGHLSSKMAAVESESVTLTTTCVTTTAARAHNHVHI